MSQLAVDGFRAEREEILTVAKGLTADEWDLPSACAGWSVRDVMGHMACTLHGVIDPAFLPDTAQRHRAGDGAGGRRAPHLADRRRDRRVRDLQRAGREPLHERADRAARRHDAPDGRSRHASDVDPAEHVPVRRLHAPAQRHPRRRTARSTASNRRATSSACARRSNGCSPGSRGCAPTRSRGVVDRPIELDARRTRAAERGRSRPAATTVASPSPKAPTADAAATRAQHRSRLRDLGHPPRAVARPRADRGRRGLRGARPRRDQDHLTAPRPRSRALRRPRSARGLRASRRRARGRLPRTSPADRRRRSCAAIPTLNVGTSPTASQRVEQPARDRRRASPSCACSRTRNSSPP